MSNFTEPKLWRTHYFLPNRRCSWQSSVTVTVHKFRDVGTNAEWATFTKWLSSLLLLLCIQVRLNAGRLVPVLAAAIVYTLMNPIGILLATIVYETSEGDPRVELANGILQALTSGCFIYVVFYEILDGQVTEATPLSRIVAIFVGYVFLASFAAIPGSSPYHYGTDAGSDVTVATGNWSTVDVAELWSTPLSGTV